MNYNLLMDIDTLLFILCQCKDKAATPADKVALYQAGENFRNGIIPEEAAQKIFDTYYQKYELDREIWKEAEEMIMSASNANDGGYMYFGDYAYFDAPIMTNN